jgi:hypothetical protein
MGGEVMGFGHVGHIALNKPNLVLSFYLYFSLITSLLYEYMTNMTKLVCCAHFSSFASSPQCEISHNSIKKERP